MATADLSGRLRRSSGYPPLSELGDLQRREFHEALLEAESFEGLPGKWQAAILSAEQNRPERRLVPVRPLELPRGPEQCGQESPRSARSPARQSSRRGFGRLHPGKFAADCRAFRAFGLPGLVFQGVRRPVAAEAASRQPRVRLRATRLGDPQAVPL